MSDDDDVIKFPKNKSFPTIEYDVWLNEAKKLFAEEVKKMTEKEKAAINHTQVTKNIYNMMIKRALKIAEEHPHPDRYYFNITFDTTDPNIIIPEWLLNDYPTEMTIILNLVFSKLHVDEVLDWFSVTLAFGGHMASIIVPFSSIITFSDVHNKFELLFNRTVVKEETEPEEKKIGDVVSFDDFKNNR